MDASIYNSNMQDDAFEGIVMAIQSGGVSKTFIVRKISGGVGVERTFPVNSPKVAGVTVVRKGKVRRAKLNYLRTLKKQAKIKERKVLCQIVGGTPKTDKEFN